MVRGGKRDRVGRLAGGGRASPRAVSRAAAGGEVKGFERALGSYAEPPPSAVGGGVYGGGSRVRGRTERARRASSRRARGALRRRLRSQGRGRMAREEGWGGGHGGQEWGRAHVRADGADAVADPPYARPSRLGAKVGAGADDGAPGGGGAVGEGVGRLKGEGAGRAGGGEARGGGGRRTASGRGETATRR